MRSPVSAGLRARAPETLAAPKVSVVIPTYNEAKNLPHVFSRLPDDLHEVIVVDGRSVDGSVDVARALRPDVRIVLQNRRGKGNALTCGFSSVSGDIIVMLDADGSADPKEIPAFVAALTAGADFAKGSRFVHGGGSTDITRVRAWGNRCLSRTANVLFGTRYTDLCYGYNAFWADCLPRLELDPGDRVQRKNGQPKRLWGDGFEIETIMNTRIAKARLATTEVPSFEFRRLHGDSNLHTFRDGYRVLRALLAERLNDKARVSRRGDSVLLRRVVGPRRLRRRIAGPSLHGPSAPVPPANLTRDRHPDASFELDVTPRSA
jgi:glycosyltransferase involved in cell wall biosynthesis